MTSTRIRPATSDDVPAIVGMLADDDLGRGRETVQDLTPYLRAFAGIDADPAHLLVVAVTGNEVDGDEVVGTLQLSVIPGLSRRGALRAQIEAVRVARGSRGSGVGAAMVGWAVEEARRRGCALVQLTSDKFRADAHRFYARLGFVASHEGLKLELTADPPADRG